MLLGPTCVFVELAQNGPWFEMPHCGIAMTASVESERSWLPRLLRFQVTRRMWYEEPEMPPAERGVPSALKPHSQRLARWPPQASTAVELVAVKRILTCDSEVEAARLTSACVT